MITIMSAWALLVTTGMVLAAYLEWIFWTSLPAAD
jgi:hypothetical protein